jgi:hypothetical protein
MASGVVVVVPALAALDRYCLGRADGNGIIVVEGARTPPRLEAEEGCELCDVVDLVVGVVIGVCPGALAANPGG